MPVVQWHLWRNTSANWIQDVMPFFKGLRPTSLPIAIVGTIIWQSAGTPWAIRWRWYPQKQNALQSTLIITFEQQQSLGWREEGLSTKIYAQWLDTNEETHSIHIWQCPQRLNAAKWAKFFTSLDHLQLLPIQIPQILPQILQSLQHHVLRPLQ